MDANGIMTVEACDKASGKKQEIKIKNDKGRLSSEDIDKMVEEAEKYKEDDAKVKARIDAKNEFESIIYQTKSSIDKEEIKSKLDEDDLETLSNIISDNETWLEDNGDATTDELNTQKDEFNTTVQPIMSKLYSGQPGYPPEGGMPDMHGMPDMSGMPTGPTIDEID